MPYSCWSTSFLHGGGRPVFGFGAGGPDQPIAFPHDVHVEEKGIQCEFCHRNVTKGDAATVPAVEQCLWCHTTIDGREHAEIVRLLEYGGLDAAAQPSEDLMAKPIDWGKGPQAPRPRTIRPRTSYKVFHYNERRQGANHCPGGRDGLPSFFREPARI